MEAAGQRLHYLDYGEGEPVLLLHGGGAGGPIWFRQIAALKERYRVLVPDHPMFGLSSQSEIPPPLRSFSVKYVSGFLDALGLDRVRVAGLSLGGFIALCMAIEHPSRIERLALLDSAGLGTDLPWVFRLITLPVLGFVLPRPRKFMQDRFFAMMESAHPNGPGSEEFKRYSFETTRNEGHPRALRKNTPSFATLRGQLSMLSDAELGKVQARTMIIWGEDDRFFPVSHAERAHGAIPDSRLHVLADTGHVSPWDQPEKVNRLLLDFFS